MNLQSMLRVERERGVRHPLVQACTKAAKEEEEEEGCGVVRKKEEETWRGRGGGGKGWLCLAVKAREGGGSPRGIRRKLAYRAGSPYPYFTSRGGGERKGREGGREVDRLATNLPMFEGEKKGGKKERQREREREI